MSKSKGRGRDSGLWDLPSDKIDKEIEKARAAGDTARVLRLIREQKVRKIRNNQKKRGGPRMRGLLWLLIPEIIRRYFYSDENI